MKPFFMFFLASAVFMLACNDEKSAETDGFTGREITWYLHQASDYPIDGTVTFKEKTDLSLQVEVRLNGTAGDAFHPVHFHYGDLYTADAEIAAVLNDLAAENGESTTVITRLTDESSIGYDDLLKFQGSVKVHQALYGAGRDVILAGGNVGAAAGKEDAAGRVDIPVCTSEPL